MYERFGPWVCEGSLGGDIARIYIDYVGDCKEE